MSDLSQSFKPQNFLRYLRVAMPVIALGIVVLVFTLLDLNYGRGKFLTGRNLAFIICDNAFITVGALGMMLIIAVGGIDLSAGTMMGLSIAVIARVMAQVETVDNPASPTFLALYAIGLAVLISGLCGLLNGTLVSALRLAPFIVTLGAMQIYLGLAHIVSDEKTVRPNPVVTPGWLDDFISERYFGSLSQFPPLLPLGVWVEIAIAIGLALLICRTVFGRHVLAVGSNETAAKLCGIRVTWVRIAVYSIAGALFGIAGIYQFGQIPSYTPDAGRGSELEIIAAVAIGGGGLSGGRASVVGTIIGSLLMAVIRSGCMQLGISNPIQYVTLGAIIIFAVLFDRVTRRAE